MRNSTAAFFPNHHHTSPLKESARAAQKQVQKPLSRSDGSWALRWNTVRSSVSMTTTNAAKAAQWPNWIGPTAAAGASAKARIGNQASKAGVSLSDRVYG